MLEVPEPAGDAAAELDDPVDGLRAAVARAVGLEVGQERRLPAAQGLAQPRDLWDRAGRQPVDESLGEPTSLGGCGLVEDVSEVLRALVGDLDCDVIGVSGERSGQAVLLARSETITPGAEDVSDPEQRVALAAAVAEGLLPESGRGRHRPQHRRA